MTREKYYIDFPNLQISQLEVKENHGLVIHANQSEIDILSRKFDALQSDQVMTMFRANTPIMLYHNSDSEDDFKVTIREALEMIYDLGDEKTRDFIDETGALKGRPIDKEESYPQTRPHSEE
ncbi:MAG TPA: hydrolase [Pseudogracilibacillus sp.]|nr:hydrolase [Pseudogracilibacillus sp.]